MITLTAQRDNQKALKETYLTFSNGILGTSNQLSELLHRILHIQTTKVATDGNFDLRPSGSSTASLRGGIDHLHQTVEVTQAKELALLVLVDRAIGLGQAVDEGTDVLL